MKLGERIRELSQRQIATILDGNLGGICIFVLRDKLQAVYLSAGFYKMLNTTAEEYVKFEQDALRPVHPNDAMKILQFVRQSLYNMTPFETSFRVRLDDGRVKWHHVHGIPYREEGFEEPLILTIIRDISRMKETELLLDTVLTSSPGGIFRVKMSENYELLYANEAFYKLRGVTAKEIRERLNNKTASFIYSEDRECVWQAIEAAAAQRKQRLMLELRVLCKGGSLCWVLTSLSFSYEEDGSIILTGIDNDITEKRALEEAVHISEARLKIAFSQTNIIVREYNFATQKLQQISFDEHGGYVEENVPDIFVKDNLVHPVSQTDYLNLYKRLREGAKSSTAIVKGKNRWESAYSWYRISYTNIFDKEGKPLRAIGTIENINEAKEAIDKYADEEQYHAIITADAVHTFHGDLILDEMLRADGFLCQQMGVKGRLSYSDFIELYAKTIVQPEWQEDFRSLTSRKNLAKSYNDGNYYLKMEFQYRMPDGELSWCSVSIHLLRSTENKNIYAYFYVRNINEKKEYELALQDFIERDSVTYLYNAETFAGLSDSILKDETTDGSKKGLMCINVEGLSNISEAYGQAYGEELTKRIAETIVSACAGSDIMGRLLGDNFAVFIPEVFAEISMLKQAMSISRVLDVLFAGEKETVHLHGHIGIAFAPLHGDSYAVLLEKALRAAKQIPAKSVNKVRIYGETEDVDVRAIRMQEENLNDEIDDLIYVVNLRTNNLLYANRKFIETYGLSGCDYSGEKCYRVVRGLNQPCDDCCSQELCTEHFCRWERTDARYGRHYLYKSKLVSWSGLPAKLIIAVDITEKENVSQHLQYKLGIAEELTACIRKVARTSTFEEGMEAFAEALKNYYAAEQCSIVEAADKAKPFIELYEGRIAQAGVKIPWRELMPEQTPLLWEILDKGDPFVFTGAGQFAKSYPHDYAYFRTFGMESACFVPLTVTEKKKGFICLINSHKTFSNLEFITSLSYFVAATINHHMR